VFSRIVLSAALAGLLSGLLWSAIQQVSVVPLILKAETFERAAESPAATGDDHAGHAQKAWAPSDGAERTIYTVVGNVILAVGLSLLLGACFAVRGNVSWRQGLIWGLGGFVAFNLAPALGLPPDLPGTEAASLEARQIWWLATVVLTSVGLAMLVFGPKVTWKAGGLALMVLPHAVGAPRPEVAGGLAPADLEHQFVIASLATNAAVWLVLGGLTALFFSNLDRWIGGSLTPTEST
jgi:cobalt transporter subunit CbtA